MSKLQKSRKGIDRLRHTYHNIKYRCYNSNSCNYKNYGAKGIRMCQEWESDFKNFYEWAIKNGYKDNLSIDRIDEKGDYCPENCRWITTSENTARANTYTHRRFPNNKKKYLAVSPTGEQYIFDNAQQFEKEHNITRGAISRCARGERRGWKSWQIKYYDDEDKS